MYLQYFRLCFLFLCLFSTKSYAYDLWQALISARSHSPLYDAARYEKYATYEHQNQAFSQLRPQVSASASHNYTAHDNSSNNYKWGITVNQTIYDKSKFSQIETELITKKIADTRFHQIDAELLLQVSKTYLNILVLVDKLRAVRGEKIAYEKQITLAKALFESGRATLIDEYEARSGLDAAITKEIDLQTQLITAGHALENMTGLPPDHISPIQMINLPNWTTEMTSDDWLRLAFEASPDLQLRSQQLVKSQADLDMSKDANYPTVNMSVGYQNQYTNLHSSSGGEHENNFYINLQLDVPIYTGGYNESRIRESKHIMYQQAALLRENQGDTVLKVKQAYAILVGKQSLITAQKRLLETNEVKLKSIQLGRTYGISNSMDEVQAQQDYTNAEVQLAEAKYAYIEAYFQLLYVTGQLNSERGENTIIQLFSGVIESANNEKNVSFGL